MAYNPHLDFPFFFSLTPFVVTDFFSSKQNLPLAYAYSPTVHIFHPMNWWLNKGKGKLPASGFRPWVTTDVKINFRPHKDMYKILMEMQAATNKTLSSIIRILLDKALGLESDPRDLASNRDADPHNNRKL